MVSEGSKGSRHGVQMVPGWRKVGSRCCQDGQHVAKTGYTGAKLGDDGAKLGDHGAKSGQDGAKMAPRKSYAGAENGDCDATHLSVDAIHAAGKENLIVATLGPH